MLPDPCFTTRLFARQRGPVVPATHSHSSAMGAAAMGVAEAVLGAVGDGEVVTRGAAGVVVMGSTVV